ncbi:hypothetical protein F4677DRAFT_441291 [Hypoxylon crocopeplum]|nr:hypothetical protein F4677DRAFT_441291 [Hypoxylon crocopeplum]
MVQGAIKSKKPSASSSGRKAKPQPPKKGARVAKSKKASTADKMQKKFSAGLVAKTEKLLGERAGHLELIGKGRVKGADKEKEGKSLRKFELGLLQSIPVPNFDSASTGWTCLEDVVQD